MFKFKTIIRNMVNKMHGSFSLRTNLLCMWVCIMCGSDILCCICCSFNNALSLHDSYLSQTSWLNKGKILHH